MLELKQIASHKFLHFCISPTCRQCEGTTPRHPSSVSTHHHSVCLPCGAYFRVGLCGSVSRKRTVVPTFIYTFLLLQGWSQLYPLPISISTSFTTRRAHPLIGSQPFHPPSGHKKTIIYKPT